MNQSFAGRETRSDGEAKRNSEMAYHRVICYMRT